MKKSLNKWIILLTLFFLWLFSQSGVITTVRFNGKDGYFQTYVDSFDAGKIKSTKSGFSNLEIDLKQSYLPQPNHFTPELINIRGYDSRGNVVFESKNTQVSFPEGNKISSIQLALKNTLQVQIKLNKQADKYDYFSYTMYRERGSFIANFDGEKFINTVNHWRQLAFAPIDSIKLILYIVLYLFPYLLILIISWKIFQKISQLIKKSLFKREINKKSIKSKPIIARENVRSTTHLYQIILILTFLSIFFYLVWVNIIYVEKIPHMPDSVNYLWQARYLAAGRFDFAKINNFFLLDGYQTYPFGHPLMLAVGAFIGFYWIIPPLTGTLFLLLLYKLLNILFNRKIAFSTILIAFFSPFFQMHAVTFMSHNTATLYLIICLYTLVRSLEKKKSKILPVICGISFGLLYYARPLTTVSLVPLFAAFIIMLLIKRNYSLKQLFYNIEGGLLILLFGFTLNYLIQGNPVVISYYQGNQGEMIGGSAGHTIIKGLTDAVNYLLLLRQVILPGLPSLFLLLLLLGLLRNDKYHFISLSLLGMISILLGWTTYGNIWGLHLGPRFWYEMVPFIFILIAGALDFLLKSTNNSIVGKGAVWFIVIVVIVKSLNGWILGTERLWGENMDFLTPSSIKALKGFNYTDARLIKEAQRQNLHNALIFVKECGGWWCYGSVANENTINFDGDIVWAQDKKEKNPDLIRLYPGRKVYFADYDKGEIVPVDYSGIL